MACCEHFALMARFNGWANKRLYKTVAGLPGESYRRDCGAVFGSIHRTLNHLLIVDRLWTGRIQKCGLVSLVDGLDEAGLGATVVYDRIIDGGREQARVDHILLGLFNHQTHHRGQVHALLTQQGVTPPPLDVIVYLEDVGLAGAPRAEPRKAAAR